MGPFALLGLALLLIMSLSGGAGAAEKVPEIKPPPPRPPRRREDLPDVPFAPVEISPVPPVTHVPGPGDAIARERAARAEMEARGARAEAAAAEAAAARADAARAEAAQNAIAAEHARAREAEARETAAREAQAARAAAAMADAARKEAEGRAAAEAMQRAREGAAAAEKARQASARIAQLEGSIKKAREQANAYIRAAQDATGKANSAIRAANDARIAAGKAKTAYEREGARRNVALKGEIARRMKIEAALKGAQAAAANANVKESEARAAIARAESAAQDARDAAGRAASERDVAMRDAAEREARLKEQLAITEAEKADAAQQAASQAKQQATQAAETARQEQAAPPLPTTPLPPAPLAPGVSEISPEVLEQKRQMVAQAFNDATTAHEAYTASVEEKARQQKIDPFWLLDDPQTDAKLSETIRAVEQEIVPGVAPARPQPKAPPAPKRPTPTVRIETEAQKKALVGDGIKRLIEYARKTFRERLKRDYPPSFAKKLGTDYEDALTVPVGFGRPRLSAMELWAMPAANLKARVDEAIRSLTLGVDREADLYALPVEKYAEKYRVPKNQLAQFEAIKQRGVPIAGFVGAAIADRKKKATAYAVGLFKKAGIPLAKPDPRIAFWRQPAAAVAARLEAVRRAVPKPIAAPARRVTGTDLERKRQKVAAAFQAAVNARKTTLLARGRKEPEKNTLAAVAAQFTRRKIPLGRPPTVSGSLHAPIAIYGRRAA